MDCLLEQTQNDVSSLALSNCCAILTVCHRTWVQITAPKTFRVSQHSIDKFSQHAMNTDNYIVTFLEPQAPMPDLVSDSWFCCVSSIM